MTYVRELGAKWRLLAAASLGQAAGYAFAVYVGNLFTPHLLKEFGWSRSAFASVGSALALGILIQPLTGRLGDLFGVRRVALTGVVAGPLVFLGLSLMRGDLREFWGLTLLQIILTSGATGAVIYSRLTAQHFDRARGIALGIAAASPPAAAALCVPFLSRFIDAHGWRAGYWALAAGTFLAGIAALALIPPAADTVAPARLTRRERSLAYGSLLKSRPFLLISAAVFLSMLSFTLQTTQLKVILLDRGIDSQTGSLALSLFAASAIAGRVLCGLALDRFAAHAVAALFVGLPAIGLGLLASGAASPALIALAVASLGLALGADTDVWPYLVSKYFGPDIYGMVLGLMFGAMALSVGIGASLLSILLKWSGSYTPFLILGAAAVLSGSALLTLLGREGSAAAARSAVAAG